MSIRDSVNSKYCLVDPKKMPTEDEIKRLIEQHRTRARYNPHPNESQADYYVANALEAYATQTFGSKSPGSESK